MARHRKNGAQSGAAVAKLQTRYNLVMRGGRVIDPANGIAIVAGFRADRGLAGTVGLSATQWAQIDARAAQFGKYTS